MESNSQHITTPAGCYELATITFNGHSFTNMGGMIDNERGRAILYLHDNQGNGRNLPQDKRFIVTSWDGSLSIPCFAFTTGRHNIARTRIDVWFRMARHNWHGVNYGENSEIVHCRRLKD